MIRHKLSAMRLVLAGALVTVVTACYDPIEIPVVTPEPGDAEPAWSPDGQQIAYFHDAGASSTSPQTGLYVLRLGEAPRLLVPGPATQPYWSPDGRYLAVTAGLHIWRVDVATGESLPLTQDGDLSVAAAWSPDGRAIAFTSDHPPSSPPDLWLMAPDGSALRRVPLSGPPRTETRNASWSPDGARLVAYVLENRPYLLVLDTLGRDTARITDAAADASDPAWSPQGDWIAYERRTTAVPAGDIWLVHPDGSGPHALVAGGNDPAWSADGRRLAYSHYEKGGAAISILDLDTGKSTQVTDPTGP